MQKADKFSVIKTNVQDILNYKNPIVACLPLDGRLEKHLKQINKSSFGAIDRVIRCTEFVKGKNGDLITLNYLPGLKTKALHLVLIDPSAEKLELRKAGANLAKIKSSETFLIICASNCALENFFVGFSLKSYSFTGYKKCKKETSTPSHQAIIMCNKPERFKLELEQSLSVVDGVLLTRDLVNEPANKLTTTNFAKILNGFKSLGLKIEILEESKLKKLGMGALLSVGQGSASPSKVVVMHWNGQNDKNKSPPLVIIGKGVVFDSGGISLKPAGNMAEMTTDMGGAGVVAGTMVSLAKRNSAANVVGIVGLVENMPSGTAIRPGDVVTSLKGDTIEILNTDAEGRLVLCDLIWYAQQRYGPRAIIDLATLTGAIVIALGDEKAGVFSNNTNFCRSFLEAASTEDEGAWRMPLSEEYNKKLKSSIADMTNIGGRPAGSITAAQFLQRFVKEGVPWIHIDIAGVAYRKHDTPYAPSGATGWGVMTLNRLIKNIFEKN